MSKGAISVLREESLEPGGQQGRQSHQSSKAELWQLMPSKISMAWSITLVCGAQLSQQWSGACLSYTLESFILCPSGSLDKCLGTLMTSGEFPQEPICEWSHSANTAVLVMCIDILGVFLLNQGVMVDWQLSWVT